MLPAQGPITAFVFLNTLQALEDLPFDEGLRRGARLFGCHPYMTEDRYRDKLAVGRIRPNDLSVALREDLGEHGQASICGLGSRFELRQAMLEHPLRIGPTEELRWFVAETDSLNRLRREAPFGVLERYIAETKHWVMRELCIRFAPGDEQPPITRDPRDRQIVADLLARFEGENVEKWTDDEWETMSLHGLWRVCRDGVEDIATFAPASLAALRHRDYLLEATGQDSDALVHDILIRFCAAFTDQGLAHWHLPHREEGFYRSFTGLYREAGGPPDAWLQGLPEELDRLDAAGMTPFDSILESLELLGVVEDEWDDFVPATLLALRGWAGMIHQMAVRADRVALSAPADSLIEFLAVRLILERLALAHVAQETMHFEGSLSWLRAAIHAERGEQAGLGTDQRLLDLPAGPSAGLDCPAAASPDVRPVVDAGRRSRIVFGPGTATDLPPGFRAPLPHASRSTP